VALTDVKLCSIRGQKLRDLCAADQEVGYHFMRETARSLGKRLLATRLQLLDLFGAADESRS
jgi:CRP/FNR family transcriptional regulator, cyclic AMP receptor protein